MYKFISRFIFILLIVRTTPFFASESSNYFSGENSKKRKYQIDFMNDDMNSWKAASALTKTEFHTQQEKAVLFTACGLSYVSTLIPHDDMKKKSDPSFYKDDSIKNRELRSFFCDNISRGYVSPMSIKLVNSKVGYGVFTQVDLAKGQYVGEFTGEVKRKKDCATDLYYIDYPLKLSSNNIEFWLCEHPYNKYVVDASKSGNEMRFLNDGGANSNCNTLSIRGSDKNQHCVFVAARDIQAGEQLTSKYDSSLWKTVGLRRFQELV